MTWNLVIDLVIAVSTTRINGVTVLVSLTRRSFAVLPSPDYGQTSVAESLAIMRQ